MTVVFSVKAHAASKCATAAAVAVAACLGIVTSAHAGGFAVREQSSSFLGMAFAGAASGADLSSSY